MEPNQDQKITTQAIDSALEVKDLAGEALGQESKYEMGIPLAKRLNQKYRYIAFNPYPITVEEIEKRGNLERPFGSYVVVFLCGVNNSDSTIGSQSIIIQGSTPEEKSIIQDIYQGISSAKKPGDTWNMASDGTVQMITSGIDSEEAPAYETKGLRYDHIHHLEKITSKLETRLHTIDGVEFILKGGALRIPSDVYLEVNFEGPSGSDFYGDFFLQGEEARALGHKLKALPWNVRYDVLDLPEDNREADIVFRKESDLKRLFKTINEVEIALRPKTSSALMDMVILIEQYEGSRRDPITCVEMNMRNRDESAETWHLLRS